MTPHEAAEWMLVRFNTNNRVLYQEDAASHLLHLHDDALSYFDGSGNVCIGKIVLTAFNKLTPELVYERSDKFWRDRLESDQPGRQQ
jgi:hypothetical protein